MKPIPFLAALLVLVAIGMPWFTAEHEPIVGVLTINNSSMETGEELSLWDIAKGIYSNPLSLENSTVETLRIESPSRLFSFLPLVGIPLIMLGAVVGLFHGKAGHGIGLIGMVLLTLPLVYSPGAGIRGSLTVGIGYILAWVGFSVGFVFSVASK